MNHFKKVIKLKKKMTFGIMAITLFLVMAAALTVPTACATNATIVANASNGDCGNVTFEVDEEDYESYCVQHGEKTPEINTVYDVEENLTATKQITEEQADKIKIFAITYNGTNLTHNVIRTDTGATVKELDDVTSRQLIIWDILGYGATNWYPQHYVNESIIMDINQKYNDGLRFADKGSFPIDNETQFNYTFKYFSSRVGGYQDFIGWLFAIDNIPPKNETPPPPPKNVTPPPPPKNETPKEPPKNETPKNETPKETPKEVPKEVPKNETVKEIQKTYSKNIVRMPATGNPLAILALAGLGLGLSVRRRRN